MGRTYMTKKVSVLIACYNETENVIPMSKVVTEQFKTKLLGYDYEICFIDNCSTDGTREKLEMLCAHDKHIKAIFNVKNFGQWNSPYYGICQMKGDCVIVMCCDFQDPPDLIPRFVAEWEKGYKIVAAIRDKSEENKIMRFLRTCYYKLIRNISSIEQIDYFSGTGLYDKSFVEILRKLDDPIPFLRNIVSEFGYKRKDIYYTQAKRKAGHTHNNLFSLYDGAMRSITSYTKIGLRIATILGFLIGIFSFIVALYYFVMKLVYWTSFPMGQAPIVIGVFFLGAMQLFFIGIMGEYILTINARTMHRPLVIEERRLNFDE